MAEVIRRFSGSYRFLSNFYQIPVVLSFTHDGEKMSFKMPSVENAFQAAKIDSKIPNRVQLTESFQTMTASESKKAGRRVPRRDDWDDIRVKVMYALLVQKFKYPTLRALLISTGDAELIEGTTWGDRFWGVDENAGGIGENHLGKLLMRVREEILVERSNQVP